MKRWLLAAVFGVAGLCVAEDFGLQYHHTGAAECAQLNGFFGRADCQESVFVYAFRLPESTSAVDFTIEYRDKNGLKRTFREIAPSGKIGAAVALRENGIQGVTRVSAIPLSQAMSMVTISPQTDRP